MLSSDLLDDSGGLLDLNGGVSDLLDLFGLSLLELLDLEFVLFNQFSLLGRIHRVFDLLELVFGFFESFNGGAELLESLGEVFLLHVKGELLGGHLVHVDSFFLEVFSLFFDDFKFSIALFDLSFDLGFLGNKLLDVNGDIREFILEFLDLLWVGLVNHTLLKFLGVELSSFEGGFDLAEFVFLSLFFDLGDLVFGYQDFLDFVRVLEFDGFVFGLGLSASGLLSSLDNTVEGGLGLRDVERWTGSLSSLLLFNNNSVFSKFENVVFRDADLGIGSSNVESWELEFLSFFGVFNSEEVDLAIDGEFWELFSDTGGSLGGGESRNNARSKQSKNDKLQIHHYDYIFERFPLKSLIKPIRGRFN